MNDLSVAIQQAIYTELSGVAGSFGIGCYYQQAPPIATFPYLIFNRQAGRTDYAFNNTRVLEDDLWTVKAYCDSESLEDYPAVARLAEIIAACQVRFNAGLTLGTGTASAVYRMADLILPPEDLNDRIIYSDGFILRVAAEP